MYRKERGRQGSDGRRSRDAWSQRGVTLPCTMWDIHMTYRVSVFKNVNIDPGLPAHMLYDCANCNTGALRGNSLILFVKTDFKSSATRRPHAKRERDRKKERERKRQSQRHRDREKLKKKDKGENNWNCNTVERSSFFGGNFL